MFIKWWFNIKNLIKLLVIVNVNYKQDLILLEQDNQIMETFLLIYLGFIMIQILLF
jgi:hypothetical protein